jgi:hypothetical protein
MESQVFSPAAFSLSAVDLISSEDCDDDEETQAANARLARYAQVSKLVDVEDIIEIVCASLKESTQLRWLIEDSLEDPHPDVTRPKVHVNELLKMGREVLAAVAIAVDEQVGMLATTHGED